MSSDIRHLSQANRMTFFMSARDLFHRWCKATVLIHNCDLTLMNGNVKNCLWMTNLTLTPAPCNMVTDNPFGTNFQFKILGQVLLSIVMSADYKCWWYHSGGEEPWRNDGRQDRILQQNWWHSLTGSSQKCNQVCTILDPSQCILALHLRVFCSKARFSVVLCEVMHVWVWRYLQFFK